MKLALVCIIVFLFSFSSGFSQKSLYNSDSTVNESVIREYRTEHLAKLYSIGSEEFNLLKSAKPYGTLANVFSVVGGGLVGWSVGGYLNDREISWTPAYIGVGFVGIAIIFAITENSYISESIDVYIKNYNSNLSEISIQFQEDFSFTSVGISIRF